MKRRNFIKASSGAILAGGLSLGNSAVALVSCGQPNFMGIQHCEAGIASSVAHISAGSVGGQHMSQWCWAACIEMVFRYYGFLIPQASIVQQTWRSIVNLPGQPGQILANLNRPWIDSKGQKFYVSGDSFSANPVTAAQDLSADMPLIIGTMGHAMVLTSVAYNRDRLGNGNVTAAVVRDPWPGRGRRILTPQEWYGTSFLARIRVHRA